MNDLPQPIPVEVVALVTSAGGLEALTTVLSGLPVDSPAAVVVQQHLGGQGSQLVSILRRRTGHAVDWAADGQHLEPGRVLVAPARRRLEILPDGSCSVAPLDLDARDRPHDVLLTSLADSYGARALAVVLTGMGRDGAAGVRALEEAGGIVLAQSEDTAEHPSMPRAAAEAGADLVLPLDEIGAVVADVVCGAPLPRGNEEVEAIRATFGDEGQVAAVARGIDWSGHPLGPVRAWSPVLRSVLALAAGYPTPFTVFWGADLIHFYNDAAASVHGAKHPSIFGLPAREAFPALVELVEGMWQVVRGGQTLHLPEMLVPIVHGEQAQDEWFDFVHAPIRHADGTVGGVGSVWHERTEQVLGTRRLDTLNRLAGAPTASGRTEALKAALGVLESSADVLFAAVYWLDVARSRAALVHATGVPVASAMAPHTVGLTPEGSPWPLQEVLEGRRQVLVEDLPARFRGHLVGPERLAPHVALLHPLRDEAEERVVGVLVLGTNPRLRFDERYREFLTLVGETVSGKVAEAQARQREHERLERLAELDRVKTEFFSNVSHEFRTPLTLLLAPLEEALRRADELPDDVAVELEVAQRNARRLLRLVGTLLDFSQIEVGRLRARFAPTDLAALTGEVASMFRSTAEAAGLKLSIDTPPLPEPVWVDAEMWEKVVSNLVSNALKFTWHGGVEVTLRALPKHAELVVRDTGVGIPAEHLPHVLTRFHRVPGSRGRTHEGAGIGLALTDELVRRHHGRVRVTSREGAGTTVTVWIPLGRRPTADAALGEPSRTGQVAAAMAAEATHWDAARERNQAALGLDDQVPEAPAGRVAGARVLVVDDNADIRNYLTRLLRSTWSVTTASDGIKALDVARRERPDLVLADVMMPALDGFGLLQAIRADDTLATVPVVLLTARAGEQTAIEGLLAGADDYVVKPFAARELLARVGAQLELARARRRAAELNAFRIRLSDALRALDDPLEIQQTGCRMLVEQLGADRARFVEVDEAAGELITMGGYAVDGMPGGFGRYLLEDYAPLAQAILAAQRRAIDDTRTDPSVEDIREALATLEIGAQLVLPLPRQDGSNVALAVHQRQPRRWTDEDVTIAEEAAGRAWAEVERARAEVALRESEERFRALAQTSPLGVGVSSADGHIVYTNRAYEAILGYEDGDLVGRPSTVVYADPADRSWLATMSEEGVLRDREVRFRRKDGSTVWVSINVAPIEFGGGPAIIGVVQDVTQRKLTEAALRASEERQAFLLRLSDALRPLADASDIKATASRLLGEQLGVNRAFYAEVDDADWLISNAYERDVEHQADGRHELARFGQWIADAFRAGQRLVFGDLHADPRFDPAQRAAHAAFHIRAAVAVPLVKDGMLVGILVVHSAAPRDWQASDIALVEETAERTWAAVERARVEAALRSSEERMRMAVRATGIVTWEWVPSEDRITTSDSVAGVYGVSALSGAEDGFALVLAEDKEAHLANVRRVASWAGGYLSEFRIRRPDDGRVVWLEERAEAQVGPDGTVDRVMGVTLDVSERKRNEAVLREAQARLAEHERLRSMSNVPGVGVLVWEWAQGTLVDSNETFLEMSGYTRAQVDSGAVTWRLLTPEEHVAESERQMEHLRWTGRIGPYEKDLVHADGSRTLMLYTGAAVGDRIVIEYCIDLRDGAGRLQRPS